MRVLLVLAFCAVLKAAEPWMLDVGGFLQFPIPAGSSELAQKYTPIVGGGGDFHWWFSEKYGVGLKSAADYLSDMELNKDLVGLTQLGEINYRFSFSEKSFAEFGAESGVVVHIFRERGVWQTSERAAPVAGGYVSLPVRTNRWVAIGPHAESLLQFFRDEDGNWEKPEWFVNIGVTASFTLDYP